MAEVKEPWYKSATTWVSIGQTIIGISVAIGYLSPEQGTLLTGNLAPICGGIAALLGALAVLTNRAEVKAVTQTAPTIIVVPTPPLAAEPPKEPDHVGH